MSRDRRRCLSVVRFVRITVADGIVTCARISICARNVCRASFNFRFTVADTIRDRLHRKDRKRQPLGTHSNDVTNPSTNSIFIAFRLARATAWRTGVAFAAEHRVRQTDRVVGKTKKRNETKETNKLDCFRCSFADS
jgi:hypothetical protein